MPDTENAPSASKPDDMNAGKAEDAADDTLNEPLPIIRPHHLHTIKVEDILLMPGRATRPPK